MKKSMRHFKVAHVLRMKSSHDQEPGTKPTKLPRGAAPTTSENYSLEDSEPDDQPISPTGILIFDLCQAIRLKPAGTPFGHLIDRGYIYHEFITKERSISNKSHAQAITLNDILEKNILNPYYFPPEKRAVVATVLASSLLQLQRTYWLNDNWNNKDIFFMTEDGKVHFDQPYVSQEFISLKGVSNATARTISKPPPEFRPKISLECLAIVLIELCFGVPIEKLKHKVKLRPLDTDDQTAHHFRLAIAHAWTWEEIRAQDSLFSDPINSCLHFPNLGRAQQGRFDEVIDDMYALIAKPLYDETIRRWPPRLDLSVRY